MRLKTVGLVICSIALGLTGCSGSSEIKDDSLGLPVINAPATPGNAAALVGATWTGGGAEYTFKEENQVVVKAGAANPMPAEYTVDEKGLISFRVGPMLKVGTWDGTALTVGNVPLTKK
ncbi:MAG: hypothetical protein HZB26_11155 [Candidatus Hydrogenedentes bacterium]|nr:hypothetical protein [Candidatus Hydrogenedentota bacterium]